MHVEEIKADRGEAENASLRDAMDEWSCNPRRRFASSGVTESACLWHVWLLIPTLKALPIHSPPWPFGQGTIPHPTRFADTPLLERGRLTRTMGYFFREGMGGTDKDASARCRGTMDNLGGIAAYSRDGRAAKSEMR